VRQRVRPIRRDVDLEDLVEDAELARDLGAERCG